MAAEGFIKSVEAVKAELKRLEEELRKADARGDRTGALNVLSRMLELQKRFMKQWPQEPRTPNVPNTDR